MKTWNDGIHFFHARIAVESPIQHPGAGDININIDITFNSNITINIHINVLQ